MAWYNTAYLYKKPITVASSSVSGGSDLTNFPVLISVIDANLKTVTNGGYVQNASGYDIIFTDSSETVLLNHEIESYSPTNGAVNMWVQIPTLSASANTTIYMYFGNSTISTSQEHVSAVWDSNYKGVWHLDHNAQDSTSNAMNGIDTAVSHGPQYIAGGATSTGNPCGISIPTSLWAGSGDFTLSFWINPNAPAAGNTPELFGIFDNTSGHFYGPTIFFDPLNVNGLGNGIIFRVDAGNQKIVTSPSASSLQGVWTKITWTRASGANTVYYGTTSVLTWTDNTSTTPANAFMFSRSSYGPQGFSSGAHADEYRFSSIARSVGWLTTAYTNESSPSTFCSFGPIQAQSATNTYIPLLTVSNTTTQVVGADQTNLYWQSAILYWNITDLGINGQLTLYVEGKDLLSGAYFPVTQSGVYPEKWIEHAVINVHALPSVWRVRVTPQNASACSYTVGAHLMTGTHEVWG